MQIRKFGKTREVVPVPSLVNLQSRSYDEFLQMNLLHEERENRGLKAVFDSMFPVHNGKTPDGSDASLEVEFVACDGPGRAKAEGAFRTAQRHDEPAVLR